MVAAAVAGVVLAALDVLWRDVRGDAFAASAFRHDEYDERSACLSCSCV